MIEASVNKYRGADMLISDIVRRNADFYCDRDAVVVPGQRTITWSQLEERTNRFGREPLP